MAQVNALAFSIPFVNLDRLRQSDHGTGGILLYRNFNCFSMELPWIEKIRNISCFPSGTCQIKHDPSSAPSTTFIGLKIKSLHLHYYVIYCFLCNIVGLIEKTKRSLLVIN